MFRRAAFGVLGMVVSAMLAAGCGNPCQTASGPCAAFSPAEARGVMRRVFDYQLAHPVVSRDRPIPKPIASTRPATKPKPVASTRPANKPVAAAAAPLPAPAAVRPPLKPKGPVGNDWERAAFYAGVVAAHRTTGEPAYLDAALAWSAEHNWRIPDPPVGANGDCCGQTYVALYSLRRDARRIADLRRGFDEMIADGDERDANWHWCDALFMSPPTMARLAAATGEAKYLDLAKRRWRATSRRLYDANEGLYYRDDRYLVRKTANGRKVFWSRGNGWVIAGLAIVLECMPPEDGDREWFVRQFRQMAAAVLACQGADGMWGTSLLDRDELPDPESSGTAFFCYALAWGVNRGVLDRGRYLPGACRAWRAVTACVSPEGKLGCAQRPAAAPENVPAENYEEYASGAFLLAGSEMLKLLGEGR
jgi:rhamnogalacturonyl hydrolase YesR